MLNKEQEKRKAIEDLKQLLQVGDTVYTILRHVSTSGMYRAISPIIIKDNTPRDISYLVAKALDWGEDKRWYGVRCSGCGMDIGFHLIYSLSYLLFNNGYALNQKWL